MSAKRKSLLSPRKLFETEELPHFGFYQDASPPAYDSLPAQHKNILLWIGEYAATYDLEKLVQALTDSFEGIWNSNADAYDRVMLSAIGVFARSQNFTLGREALDTLVRIDCAKQHPSYPNFIKELKIQIALAVVRNDHKKTSEFAESIKMIAQAGDDPETIKELVEFGRLLKSKHGGKDRDQQIAAYFAKHSVERFQKEVLQFIKDVKESQPLPFLEHLEKDFKAGKYKPSKEETSYSYKELEVAFAEDTGNDLIDVYSQEDPVVKEFLKKKQKKPEKKQLPASKPNKIVPITQESESEEEPLKKKKKAVSPSSASKKLETRETLTQLDKESKRLYAHGKDPLLDARKNAPKKSASSKETTPQSRPASAASSAEKHTSILDRRATAQTVEWDHGSDEDEEEDEFMDIEEHILNTPKRLLEKRELNTPELISPNGKTVRRRIKWTTEEEDMLLEGYIKYPNQWARIKRKYTFTGRTGVDLKDKYRNLLKHFDDTQSRVTRITEKLKKQREDRVAKGLKADETDSEVEKQRQKESAKKHARKSKRIYNEEDSVEESEEEEDEPVPLESDSDSTKKRKNPRRKSGERAKKRISQSSQQEKETEDEQEEEDDVNKTKDQEEEDEEEDYPDKGANEEEEEEEEEAAKKSSDESSDKDEPSPAPKKTVKKTRRRKRRYQ